jgi:hypothetical protein
MNTFSKPFQHLPTLHTLAALLWLAPLAGQAEDFAYTTNNGTITITKYIGAEGDVVVPDTINALPVTGIGTNAFDGNNSLATVTISTNVTSIEDDAFSWCTNLTTITLPPHLSRLDEAAFYLCERLQSVTIPDGVPEIGASTFTYCHALTNVSIPGTVTSIGEQAFAACEHLASIILPDGLTSIGLDAFFGCSSLSTITLGPALVRLDPRAFAESGLSEIYFRGAPPEMVDSPFDYRWDYERHDYPMLFVLPGTDGWGEPAWPPGYCWGRPVYPWHLPNPTILQFGSRFGVQTNRFGFRISWFTNAAVVVEASTSLASTNWTSLKTNTVAYPYYFSYFGDSDWTNHPARFYRVRSL